MGGYKMKHFIKSQTALLIGSLLVSACSFTGYGGESKFRCNQDNLGSKECASISQNFTGTHVLANDQKLRQSRNYQNTGSLKALDAPSSGMPIRTQTEVVRIWVAPYLDTDGDLIDQSFSYVALGNDRWMIEHNRQNIIDEYRPVRLLGQGAKKETATPNIGHTQNVQADTLPNLGIDMGQAPGLMPK